MNEKYSRFTITDFKDQVSAILQASTHFSALEYSEACTFLQKCIRILETRKNILIESSETVQASNTTELPNIEEMCIQYSENYLSMEELKRSKVITNKCPKCDKQFESDVFLLEHLTSHTGCPLSCKTCQNTFGNSTAYEYHMKLNLCQNVKNSDERTKMYHLCNKTSLCCKDLIKHVDGHKCIDCKTCNAYFTDRKHLEFHSLEVHDVQQENHLFRCCICNTSFVNCHSLVRHYRLIHNCEGEVCTECGEFVNSVSELKDHKQKQHSLTHWDLNSYNELPFNETHVIEDNTTEHECPDSISEEPHHLNVHHDNSSSLSGNSQERVQFGPSQRIKSSESSKNKELCVKYDENFLVAEEFENIENISAKCPRCEKQFENNVFLLEHLMSYTGSPLSCKKCQNMFTNNTAYDYHVKLKLCEEVKNTDERRKICQLCNKTFHSVSNYRKHIDGHKRNDCKVCDAHFTNRKHLEVHSLEVHNTQLEKHHFRCHLCTKTFIHRRSLTHHYSLVHSDDGKACSKCAKFFVDADELKIHEQTHSVKQWVCERCNDKFSRRQQYLVHIQSHDRYHCITCNESFAAKNKIIEHERRGHSVRGLEPQHQCAECGETFHSKSNLNSHAGCHNVVKKYTCVPCKKNFKKYSHYTRHQLSAAHINDQPPVDELLACSVCKKTFRYRHELVSHQKRVHKPEHKARQCEFCSYKTTCESNMKRHVALHTQKQQFICEKCGSSFYTKNSLKEHDKCVHSDERNYSCDKCGRAFKLISTLNRHMLTHSEERPKVCHCGNAYKFACNLRHHQLLVHGKVDSVKKIKRLYKDESTPVKTQNKVKKKVKLKQTEDSSDPLISVINSQVVTLPSSSLSISPSSSSVSQNTLVLMSDRHDPHLLQVPYQNVSFSSESKSHLLYTQSLDIQVAESMLHLGNKTLKTDQNVLLNPSSHNSIFTRPITDSDNNYIHSEEIMHPSVQPSLISSLEESLHDSADQSDPKQTLMTALPDYIPHSFNFLNV